LLDKKIAGGIFKDEDCSVKNRRKILIYMPLTKLLFPLFFTGRKLRPPGIGTEATAYRRYCQTVRNRRESSMLLAQA